MKLSLVSVKPMKLQSKMILLILALVLFATAVVGSFSLRQISTIIESQIGNRALKVSQTIALIPAIRQDLEKGDLTTSRIQKIAENARRETGAQFIVVGDQHGRRFSHPIEERIGQMMVGGDNYQALEKGHASISKATGTLGLSIRGKSPVFDNDHNIIGVVSVGYLMEDINSSISQHRLKFLIVLALVIFIGIAITIKITNDLKNAIFGLEPKEIANLLQERTATLEAIREGIMAIDGDGLITTVNYAAFHTLGINSNSNVIGTHVKDMFPETRMLDVLVSGESQLDKILYHNDKEIIINRIPIITDNKVTGVVSSFRDKSELDIIAEKLSQIQKYSDMLRVQTHEYSNKLHTISGLIQIGAYDEAIELIGNETSGYQDLINSLMTIVKDPIIAGTILGKYNKAKELKIKMVVDPDSSMGDIPARIKRQNLVTIIGNILDNGFEAVIDQDENHREVRLSMTDLGNDLIFEFDDSGKGIDPVLCQQIFTNGFTTKEQEGHGVGLYLVDQTVLRMGGNITVGPSDLGGTAFTVIIPKGG